MVTTGLLYRKFHKELKVDSCNLFLQSFTWYLKNVEYRVDKSVTRLPESPPCTSLSLDLILLKIKLKLMA